MQECMWAIQGTNQPRPHSYRSKPNKHQHLHRAITVGPAEKSAETSHFHVWSRPVHWQKIWPKRWQHFILRPDQRNCRDKSFIEQKKSTVSVLVWSCLPGIGTYLFEWRFTLFSKIKYFIYVMMARVMLGGNEAEPRGNPKSLLSVLLWQQPTQNHTDHTKIPTTTTVDVIQTRCSSFGNAQVEAVEQPPGWVLLYPDSLSSGSPPTLGTVTWRVCLTGSAVLFTSPLLKCLQRQHIPKSFLIRWTWLLFFGFHTAQLCCRSNGLQ